MAVAAVVLLVLATIPAIEAQAAGTRRFALLVANHKGGKGTASLRYAKDDALKLGEVLVELGGYDPSDIVYVLDGTADQARKALLATEARLQKARGEGAHTSLVFYYSGHARDGALRLGETRWPMGEIRSALSRSSADVRIGILDACQSGAITRAKGGRPGPSFLHETDDRPGASGMVLISSSSDDENSQESDELGGSYFTHYLASGLRGDADESGDRRVTLGEVYLYAYHKTIEQTLHTRSGVQHPSYSYDLQGSGHLVLTDLTMGRSGVRFAEDLEGEYVIFDKSRAQVAAEVKKIAGRPRRISLPPGEYVIKKRLSDHLRMQRFRLEELDDFVVQDAIMDAVAFEDDYAKGRLDLVEGGLSPVFEVRFAYQTFLSDRARRELFPPSPLVGGSVGLDQILGARLALDLLVGGTGRQDLVLGSLSVPYDFLELQAGVELLWSLGDDRWSMLLGPRIAGLYLRRSFPDDRSLAAYTQDHFALSPAVVSGLRYGFDQKGRWSIAARATVGLLSFGVDENLGLVYAEAGLTLGLKL